MKNSKGSTIQYSQNAHQKNHLPPLPPMYTPFCMIKLLKNNDFVIPRNGQYEKYSFHKSPILPASICSTRPPEIRSTVKPENIPKEEYYN